MIFPASDFTWYLHFVTQCLLVQVSAIHKISKWSDRSRYTIWWSVPSYLDCRAKPCVTKTHHTGVALPGQKAGYPPIPEEDPSAEWRTLVVQKNSLRYRLNRQAAKCGEPQESRRRSSRSILHTSRPGWKSLRSRPGGKCSPPPGVLASVRPGRTPLSCSTSPRGQPGWFGLPGDGWSDGWRRGRLHLVAGRRDAHEISASAGRLGSSYRAGLVALCEAFACLRDRPTKDQNPLIVYICTM